MADSAEYTATREGTASFNGAALRRAKPSDTTLIRGACAVAVIGFCVLYYRNAWVGDDAYISLRTVYNAVNGYGLRWNPDERVQAYTHPLWLLLHLPIAFITRDYFYSNIALSFATCAATFAFVASRLIRHGTLWKLPLLLLAVASSKAVFDYCSSGLENPLSYLIAATFYWRWLERDSAEPFDLRAIQYYVLLASLAFVTRQDTVLVYLPALATLWWRRPRGATKPLLRTLALATSPAWLWTAFTLFYYGFALPNTYLAKAGNAGVPLLDRWELGYAHLVQGFSTDLPSFAYLVAMLWWFAQARRHQALAPVLGVAFYILYILTTAGSANHMAHRFEALPTFIAILVLLHAMHTLNTAWSWAVCAFAAFGLMSNSPARAGTKAYEVTFYPNSIDTKAYVLEDGGSLKHHLVRRATIPDVPWHIEGRKFSALKAHAHWGGPGEGHPAMGYFGFGAGPKKFVVDPYGLCDPLLARLKANAQKPWRTGHFLRTAPEGYLASVETGTNLIKDPKLHTYYEKLRTVTRGPLFSLERFKDILYFNVGAYEHYLEREP